MSRAVMTGAELVAFRQRRHLTQSEAARLMGFTSATVISAMEHGRQAISPQTARLIRAYDEGYRPADWYECGGSI